MEVVWENGNVENELVEVARFPSSFEASLALGELEEAGISACLANEASSEWMTYLGTHDVGVGLLTSSADAEKARNILEQREQVDEIPDQGEEEAGAEGEDENEVRGPEDWAKRALLSAFAGLFIFPFSLYAIWIVIRHGLLSRRKMVSIRGPLTTLVVAVIGLVINLLFIVGQFFQ